MVRRLRLTGASAEAPFGDFDDVMAARRAECDDFYRHLQRDMPSEDARNIQRQAFAGLIWSKQYYHFDIPLWLKGDPGQPPPPEGRGTAATSNGAIS